MVGTYAAALTKKLKTFNFKKQFKPTAHVTKVVQTRYLS